MNFAAEIYKPGSSTPSIPYLVGRKFEEFVRCIEPTVRGKDILILTKQRFNIFNYLCILNFLLGVTYVWIVLFIFQAFVSFA